MKTAQQILHSKGKEIWQVDPGASVFEALGLMAEKNVGALLVVRDAKLLGIFSERDYARKVILRGKHSKDTQVREIMTEKPICVAPSATIEDCMNLMTDNHIRHLPVMEGERLLGIISIGDVVKGIITEQQGTISDLEGYITGRR